MPRRKKENKKDFVYAVGRRKEASARVRLFKGKGETLVNKVMIADYFPGKVARTFYEKPFFLTDTLGKYYATIGVAGGGLPGQLSAVVHGLSRALARVGGEKFKPALKKAGLLTRDARVRERRKVGTGGKARRRKQSPKR